MKEQLQCGLHLIPSKLDRDNPLECPFQSNHSTKLILKPKICGLKRPTSEPLSLFQVKTPIPLVWTCGPDTPPTL